MSKPFNAIAELLILLCGARAAHSSALSHYERPTGRDHHYNERVIVFVHGIFGNGEDTWRFSPTVYWPKLLLTDEAFKNTDVYVADYESPHFGNTMTVDEVAANLNNRLKSDSVFAKHREVIFVCHSLGGLIIQQLLLTHREYAEKVPFIYFFATPQTGSEIAKLGRLFSSDPLLEALLPGGENHYMESIEFQWKSARFNIRRYCAYEKKPYKGVLIVDRLSSTRNCDDLLPIDEDHVSIVKPNNTNHDSYTALRNAILDHPLPQEPKSRGKSTPKDGPYVIGGSKAAKAEPSERAVLRVARIEVSITDGKLTANIYVQNVGKYIALPTSIVRVAVEQSPPLSPADENKLFDGAPFESDKNKAASVDAPNWQRGGIISLQPWYPGDTKTMNVRAGPKFVERYGLVADRPQDIETLKSQVEALKSGDEGWYILTRALFKDKAGPLPYLDSCTYFSAKMPTGFRCWYHND
jgi:pimeloyl-ACP methyl ester carboxylesterase